MRHRQLWVKDLPKVPTWRLERELNPWPSGWKLSTQPMHNHVPQVSYAVPILTILRTCIVNFLSWWKYIYQVTLSIVHWPKKYLATDNTIWIVILQYNINCHTIWIDTIIDWLKSFTGSQAAVKALNTCDDNTNMGIFRGDFSRSIPRSESVPAIKAWGWIKYAQNQWKPPKFKTSMKFISGCDPGYKVVCY